MALLHTLEKEGNILFKYRGQIPVLLFIAAIPVLFFTDYSEITTLEYMIYAILSTTLSLSGFIFRALAIGTSAKGTSGRNTEEQVAETLNHTGIYSMVRHPLYVGNYFMWIGIVLFTFNIYYVIIVTLAYWLYYERIMFAEEQFLMRKFKDVYTNWSLKTPSFIPSIKNYVKSNNSLSIKTILRREYSGVLATIIGYVFVDLIRIYFTSGKFAYSNWHLYALGSGLFITLVLRSLKHYTKVLHEEDRS